MDVYVTYDTAFSTWNVVKKDGTTVYHTKDPDTIDWWLADHPEYKDMS